MYARMLQSLIKPDMLETATAIGRDGVLPAARRQPGFKGLIALSDPATGKTVTVTLWTSEVTMRAGEASGYLDEQLERITATLAAPSTQEALAVRALEAVDPHAMQGRLISYQVNPLVFDDFVATFRDDVLPAARRERGFSAGLLLINPAAARAVSLTLWGSEADLEGGQVTGDLRERLSHLSRLLLGPPVREVFAVNVLEILP